MFDLPLRALNWRQQDIADKSRPLGSADFLAATECRSNAKLIIRMDATSFRLQSKHGLDDGWNERKDNPSLTAESLFAEAHLRPDDVDLEATHHQSFWSNSLKGWKWKNPEMHPFGGESTKCIIYPCVCVCVCFKFLTLNLTIFAIPPFPLIAVKRRSAATIKCLCITPSLLDERWSGITYA